MVNRKHISVRINGASSSWLGTSSVAAKIINKFFWGSSSSLSKLWVKIAGVWKECIPYIKVSGVWKQAIPYIKIGGIWKPNIIIPQRILIDLGGDAASSPAKTPINNPDRNGNYWNKFVATGLYSGSGLPVNGFYSGLSLSNLVTFENVNTGITMTLVTCGNTTYIGAGSTPGLNGDGITNGVNEYIPQSTVDSMFTDNSSSPGQLLFSGLNTSKTYSFKFWGSRMTGGATDNRFIEIKKSTDIWSAAINYNSSNNTSNLQAGIISGITGVTSIAFDFRSMSGSQFGYIGIIDITVT